MKAPTLYSLAILVLTAANTNFASVQLDSSFQGNFPGTVNALVCLNNGSILVGGDLQDGAFPNLVKLQPNGSIDASFQNSGANSTVNALAPVNGGILAAGRFSTVDNSTAHNIARLLPSGGVDGSFDLASSGSVDCLAVDAQGRTLIGGSFQGINGRPAIYLARLLANGSPDPGFEARLLPSFAMEAGVTALAIQSDGKILVGGNFETENGFQYLARLNDDGSLDRSFSGDHGAILYVKAILPLTNGRVLVAGQGRNGRGFVRRLNGDRSVDSSFAAPEFDGAVHAMALGADGKLVVGGAFRAPGRGLNRLNANGSADSSWTVGVDGPVNALAFDASGRLLVGGAFQNGVTRVIDTKLNSFATNKHIFRGALQCEAGQEYIVETSSDLVAWTTFGTGTGTSDGLEVVDLESSVTVKRFFRARLVQ